MAPPTTSCRSKKDFNQWKEPSQVVGSAKNVTGVAPPTGSKKKTQATRKKLIMEAAEDSRTARESNSGP